MSKDIIYREDAIEVLAINAPFMSDEAYLKSYDALKSIPSADRPQGEWIQTSNDWIDGTCGARYYPIHCSICNYSTYDDDATNYCPNCGADMRKGADDDR